MPDLFSLDNKVAVVIGGGGGIGKTLASALAEQGAKVVIASRDQRKLDDVATTIQSKAHCEVTALSVDVLDEKSVALLAEQVMSKFGRVDILINSQGANIKALATEFSVPNWDTLFGVNVKGIMLTCREFGKLMIKMKKGKVINLSSTTGVRATMWAGNEGYCATKGAVDMITRSLAAEWAPYNVNVNAIAPGIVATELSKWTVKDPARLSKWLSNVPLGRIAQPEDLIGACIFLASPASDYITGQILHVDGGNTAVG